MRKTVIAAILLASVSLGADGAQAQTAPWCAHYNTGLNACSFYSFEQCMASVFGVGGTCARNQLEAPHLTVRDPYRSYRRSYG